MNMKQLRLLPLLLLVASLTFALRVGEVVSGFREISGAAQAEDAQKAADTKPEAGAAEKSAPETKDAKPADDKAAATDKDKKPEGDTAAATDKKTDDAKAAEGTADKKAEESWPDPAEMDPELADVKSGLLKDLSSRRKQLDEREQQLSTREAILKAAESELDQKYSELSELRKQLQGLLNQQSQEESDRIKSLVQIYEGMKPADAARIFNTLDLNVLLDVMTRMSERKTAPVLAAMDADRARTVTMLMAQQKKLPDLPDLAGAANADAASAGGNSPPPPPAN